jgi:putative flippase GtrA
MKSGIVNKRVVNKSSGSNSAASERTWLANIPFLARINPGELLRFGIVGLSSLGFYYLLFIGFVELFGVPVLISAVIAYLISMVWNYWRQRNWTFKSDRGHKSAIPGYLLTHAIGMGINTFVLYVLTYHVTMYYILAQVFATCAVAAWSYLSFKVWVFKNR